MPKKQIDDDEDIIEIEEFSEPKPGKSGTKQISDKKAKNARSEESRKKAPPSDSEEEESEEEKPVKKSKPKKPISEKRLEVLKKGREIAAANRAKKKEEQIAKLKKELWEDFNGKIPRAERSTSEAVKNAPLPPPPPPQNLPHPQEIISKMKERASLEPPSQTAGRKIKSFCKIKI